MSQRLPAVQDLPDLARIRAVLHAAGYDAAGIQAIAGGDLTHLGGRALPVVVHRTPGGSRLETLVRLFTAGAPVPYAVARRALAPTTVEEWVGWGLLTRDAGEVAGTVQLACHGELVVATDWGPPAPGIGTPPDYVMGFSPSGLTLARMTVRNPSRDTLDVGTGSGLQALLAAAHSRSVLATDVNPRAVALARFNAALNGLANVECVEGDMLRPAGRRTFDLVVSNPPFVVAPPVPHLFMSSGHDGDEVCAELVRTAPRHLTDGGWCQLLANWSAIRGEDWREHLARWFDGVPCDTWVIRRERQAADEYAALWIETETDDADEYATRFDAWMSWYDGRGIEAVDYGLVTMRKRGDGSAGRLRCDDIRGRWDEATGADLASAFARHDWLASTTDDALLDARLSVADTARLQREMVAVRGEWVPIGATLHAAGGMHAPGGVDPQGERIVGACDGETTVRALLTTLAETVGVPFGEVAPDALRTLRALVERGILLPPSEPAG